MRTVAIGIVEQAGERVQTTHLFSFSCMVDAATFGDVAEAETRRRRVTYDCQRFFLQVLAIR